MLHAGLPDAMDVTYLEKLFQQLHPLEPHLAEEQLQRCDLLPQLQLLGDLQYLQHAIFVLTAFVRILTLPNFALVYRFTDACMEILAGSAPVNYK